MSTPFRFVVDNRGGNSVETVLRQGLRPKTWNSVATAYFTISGFQLVADELEKTLGFRLLIGSEPGVDPLNMLQTDIWRNIDVRGSSKNAERAITFFSRDDVKVKLHVGAFMHGKAYILNHPKPEFAKLMGEPSDLLQNPNEPTNLEGRFRPHSLLYKGPKVTKTDSVISLVGSSNFTHGGLQNNTELNLLDNQGESAIELLTWFQERWEDSKDIKDEFLKCLQGYYTPFDPFLIYAKALWDLYKEDLQLGPELGKPGSNVELAAFQYAGYQTAKRILERWGGVLIADAPGLGKTYIAGRVMEDYAYHRREPTLIICPAEVESIWRKFCEQHNVGSPTFLHTEALGRGMRYGTPEIPVEDYKNYSFILVDESHHFRNPNAGRYAWLQQLLAMRRPEVKITGKVTQLDRKVVFVTATPVNNSVWDLYAQLLLLFGARLQEIAARQGIRDVVEYFKSAQEGAGNLYDLIEAIAVRRSRTAIRKYFPDATIEGERIRFPERKLDHIDYIMDPKLNNLHELAVRAIDNCTLVPYRTARYRIGLQDDPDVKRGDVLSDLFRILLLKRLESSVIAFRQTVKNIVDLMERSLAELKEGRVFSAENLREYVAILQGANEDDGGNAQGMGRELAEEGEFDVKTMTRDLEQDLLRLTPFLSILPEDPNQLALIDRKLLALKEHMKNERKKILIFCSFIDTANYLFENLKSRNVVVGLVTGDESRIWDGSEVSGCDRSKIIDLFSPVSNRRRLRGDEKEIEVLIATDVLSEAINLQDAGVVLNYDFPWNPMKLVQRTGRIDRIGSKFETIKVYNIFANDGLENILQLMKRLLTKIAQAHRSVGLEWSLIGEEPVNVDFTDVYNRLKRLDSKVINEQEGKMEGIVGLDPQEQLLAILQNLSREKLESIPDGAGSFTKRPEGVRGRRTGTFIAYRRKIGNEIDKIWRFYPDDKLEPISNKTEIAEQIQFAPEHRPENRFGDESLQRLRSSRLALEDELQRLDAEQRTDRISAPVRKAFQLVQSKGLADLDRFLQSNSQEPAVQRAIRRINFENEKEALEALRNLAAKLGEDEMQEETLEKKQNEQPIDQRGTSKINEEISRELPPLPKGFDPNLELVCWMHII